MECNCPNCMAERGDKSEEELENYYNNHPEEGVVINDETILFYAFSNTSLRKARAMRKVGEAYVKPKNVCEWDMSEVAAQIVGEPQWLNKS